MPFYLYEEATQGAVGHTINDGNEAIYNNELTNPNLVPIFLIPSVYGDGNEFQHLIAKLHAENSERPIYYYRDELLTNTSTPVSAQESLTMHGKSIAKQIANILKTKDTNPILIGYSYGCMLAAEAAKYLLQEGADPHVYIIDGIERETSKSFYNKNKDESTLEISIMINLAAKINGLNECKFTTDDIDSAKLILNIKERAGYFYHKILEQNKPAHSDVHPMQNQKLALFKKQFEVICQNLHNLSNNKRLRDQQLPHLTAILTQETIKKVQANDAGWGKIAAGGKLRTIQSSEAIVAASHLDLVRDTRPDGLTAQIANYLATCISTDVTVNTLAKRTALSLYELIAQSKGGTKPNTIKITYGSSPTNEPTVEISSSSSSDKEDSSDDCDLSIVENAPENDKSGGLQRFGLWALGAASSHNPIPSTAKSIIPKL